MYQAWGWPTAVNPTDTSAAQTTATTVGAVNTQSVTPQWPAQTVAFGQYAVPAAMQQQWAAWSYPYTVGQVRPQYPQVPLPGAYTSAAQAYQTPQAYQNANALWQAEGYQTTSGQASSTESKTDQPPQTPQPSETSNSAPKAKGSAADNKEELVPKDEAEQEKLNQLRAQAQQWKSQQEAGPTAWAFPGQTTTAVSGTVTSTTAPIASTTASTVPQGSWPQGSWGQNQWNQQWSGQTWPQQSENKQQEQSNSFQKEQSQPKPEKNKKAELQASQPGTDEKGDGTSNMDKEAEEFERQFVEWEKQFETWKQQNINHPDKEAFAEYEKQWQEYKNTLMQRREEMQQARAEQKKNSISDQGRQSDRQVAEGQSPAIGSQLTPRGNEFNSPANVPESGAATNQMIPGLDNIHADQGMPQSTAVPAQGSPAIPPQSMYYVPPPQNLMYMPPPHPYGPYGFPYPNQGFPPPNAPQFPIPGQPPPPPPAGNMPNEMESAKSFPQGEDDFKMHDQKRPLLSTPPQSGDRVPAGLLRPPQQDNRFGPPRREFDGPDMMREDDREFPSPRKMNMPPNEFENMPRDDRDFFPMDDRFPNRQFMQQREEMDHQEFDDGWGYGPGRGRMRGGYERDSRQRGRGRGRSRWGDEDDMRPFDPQMPEGMQFRGDTGGPPRDFPESRRGNRWGPTPKDTDLGIDMGRPMPGDNLGRIGPHEQLITGRIKDGQESMLKPSGDIDFTSDLPFSVRNKKKNVDDRFKDMFVEDHVPPFVPFENENIAQDPLGKDDEQFPGPLQEGDRFPPEGKDENFPPGRERFSGPPQGRERFPPGKMSERERMGFMGPRHGMEQFDDKKFPPHMPFERDFPHKPPFDDERFPRDDRFPFRDPERDRFMGDDRFPPGRFQGRNNRFGPKNFPPDEMMGRPGMMPRPDSPFMGPDGPFIPDAPFPIPDAPFMQDRPFPPEKFRGRNIPFDEEPRFGFPEDRFAGPHPFDREKGHPFDREKGPPPFGRPHPFDRGEEERFNMRFKSIDYTHQPAAAVLGEEFTRNFEAFDGPYGADLMNYRAVFDYAHRRNESPHPRDRNFNREQDLDENRDDSRDRTRDRSRDRSRDQERERDRDRRDRERNRDKDNRSKDRGRERDSEKDRDRDRRDNRDRDRIRDREERNRDNKRDREKDREDGESKRSRWEPAQDDFSSNRNTDSSLQRQNGERNPDEAADLENCNSSQIPPQPDIFKTDVKPETTIIKDLLYPPGRFARPKQLVIILRGLPGSGKTYVAKLIKDKEVENGGSAPRILSLDDYFMVEREVTDIDPESGKRLKRREFQFEYEKDMEEAYRTSLYKSFKKTIDDRFFPFLIVDAIHEKVKHFEQYWSYAKQRGFQVYIADMDCKDPMICFKRNVHNRIQSDIVELLNTWEKKPQHFMELDTRGLLQDVSITEVEMEDLHSEVKKEDDDKEDEPSKTEEAEDTDDFMHFHVPSRWEKLENTEEKLDKLDGLLGSKKKHSSMEDYLQLPDDYENRPCEPGKKRVRWADLEERKEQDRLRAIGFVVGQTDWTKMTDPSHADRALTRTKYI